MLYTFGLKRGRADFHSSAAFEAPVSSIAYSIGAIVFETFLHFLLSPTPENSYDFLKKGSKYCGISQI
jgi:hypothetical protein